MPELIRTRQHTQDRVSRMADPNDVIAEIKGEKYREYRRRFEASGKGKLKLDFPVDLSIESVDYCNYRCPYCPRIDEPGSKARLPDDAFQKIVDEFAEKTEGMGAIGFDSGEPMLDKHLEHKVKYINDKGIVDIILTTNGSYLTPERSRALIEAGLTKLHVSVDAATQETYTKTRGGNLALVESNLMNFLKVRHEMNVKIPILRLSFVMSELNLHEKELFEEKWIEVADYVEFQDCIDHSRVNALVDYEVKPFWCQYPFQSASVLANGDILPCCSFYANPRLVFGSVHKGDTVDRVFNSERAERLRQSFLKGKDYDIVCKNCRVAPPYDMVKAGKAKNNPLLQPVALPAVGSAKMRPPTAFPAR